MPNLTPEQQEINSELLVIHNLIYGRDPSHTKDIIAADRLLRLVERRIPYAIMLQAVFIWHCFGFEEAPYRAYALATEAAELGEMDALVVLASMHFVGYGCEQNFEKSLTLLERFNNEAPSVPIYLNIGEVSLSYFNFRTEFILNVNGQKILGPMDALEKLNRWILHCKRKCIARQAETLKRNPKFPGFKSYRNLPFKGCIGGSPLCLKGKDYISQIGFRNSWLEEAIWFETDCLTEWPKGISFDGLTELEGVPTAQLVEMGKAYLANRHKGSWFELQLIGSSVHRELKFFCDADEIMSVFEG